MNSLTDRFKQPLPAWVSEIRKEALRKISLSPFAIACRAGDMTLTKDLFLRFWPFVEAFPKDNQPRLCAHPEKGAGKNFRT
jgi:hypothetical protein